MRLAIGEWWVEVGKKLVVRGAELALAQGEVMVVSGPNGGGKSSLVASLWGATEYRVVRGWGKLEGVNLCELAIEERTKKGLLVAHQQPPIIPGLKVFQLGKTALQARGEKVESLVKLKTRMEELLVRVGLAREYLGRSVNVGFSGGEKKRLELWQILLLEPKVVILDEIDSGLDSQGKRLVEQVVKKESGRGVSFVVVTHDEGFGEKLAPSQWWEMRDGKLQVR